MSSSVVEVRDRGAKRVSMALRARRPSAVDVGVLGPAAAETHGSDGITIVELAAIHEFGLGVPRRSWLRDFVRDHEKEIRSAMRKISEQMVRGQITRDQALSQLGSWIQGQIQARIAAGIYPELAQSTIDKKGSSTPLIDTGQLRSSITHRVAE